MSATGAPPGRDDLARLIEAWLDAQRRSNPLVAAVGRDAESDHPRWFVRLLGEEKDVFSVWLVLGQRTLGYETYLMPAPEDDPARLYEHLLRRNATLYGAAFTIGEEDGIFIAGRIDRRFVDEDELDRILGSLYQWTEQFFRPALRIGFSSRLGGG